MNYRENVMRLMRDRNLTGPIVAGRMGITSAAFYRSLENPTLSSMERLAGVLGVPVSRLLMEEGDDVGEFACPHCGGLLRVIPKGV